MENLGDSLLACSLVGVACFCLWRIYAKAGERGWSCLIPVYNLYVLCRIAGTRPVLLVTALMPFINVFALIYVCTQVARRFGKPRWWGLGMVFVPWLFLPLLAFAAKFVGDLPEDRNWGHDGPPIDNQKEE